MEKQLQQEKQPHIYYQESQQEIFKRQLIVLKIIQIKREQLQKIQQEHPLNYQQLSVNSQKTLKKYLKRQDKLQNLEQSLLNEIQSHRTKTSNPWLHGLGTTKEGMNQRYLKNWADMADEIAFGPTLEALTLEEFQI